MTGHINLVPKRRFKEFQNTHSWEKRELDSIYKKIRNAFVGTATPYYVESGNFYLESNNVKDGKINRITEIFINDEFYEKQKDKWLHTGDLVMVQSGHVGHTAVIEEELDGTAAHALIMFQEYKEQADPYFLNFQFQTKEAKRKLENITTGNTIKHILASEMKKFEVTIPQIQEQNKIGTFFEAVDDIIALHQRKLEKTKALKAAYLSEMFPDEGECVPKRRFAGFTHAWEQCKLGELGSVAMNKRIFKEQTAETGEVPFYKIGTFGGDPDAFISRGLFEEYKAKYPYPEVGDILISASGSIGRTVEYKGEDEYFQDSNIVWLKHDERLDNSFLKQFYSIVKWQGLEGSTIKRLYNKNILDTGISVPSLAEQQKIGQFFNQLDNLITLHQRKLEKLQNIKKAYLNEMFV